MSATPEMWLTTARQSPRRLLRWNRSASLSSSTTDEHRGQHCRQSGWALSVALTLHTYWHVLPQMQREATDIFAAAVVGGQ